MKNVAADRDFKDDARARAWAEETRRRVEANGGGRDDSAWAEKKLAEELAQEQERKIAPS
jgi:hypothetical protein